MKEKNHFKATAFLFIIPNFERTLISKVCGAVNQDSNLRQQFSQDPKI